MFLKNIFTFLKNSYPKIWSIQKGDVSLIQQLIIRQSNNNNMKAQQIALHANKESDKVVKFIDESEFKSDFLSLQKDGCIYGVYLDSNNNVVADDIWGETHNEILK